MPDAWHTAAMAVLVWAVVVSVTVALDLPLGFGVGGLVIVSVYLDTYYPAVAALALGKERYAREQSALVSALVVATAIAALATWAAVHVFRVAGAARLGRLRGGGPDPPAAAAPAPTPDPPNQKDDAAKKEGRVGSSKGAAPKKGKAGGLLRTLIIPGVAMRTQFLFVILAMCTGIIALALGIGIAQPDKNGVVRTFPSNREAFAQKDDGRSNAAGPALVVATTAIVGVVAAYTYSFDLFDPRWPADPMSFVSTNALVPLAWIAFLTARSAWRFAREEDIHAKPS